MGAKQRTTGVYISGCACVVGVCHTFRFSVFFAGLYRSISCVPRAQYPFSVLSQWGATVIKIKQGEIPSDRRECLALDALEVWPQAGSRFRSHSVVTA